MAKLKELFGAIFIWVGSFALLIAFGGLLTFFYNKLIIYDRPLKLVGMSMAVILILLVIGIILLIAGRIFIIKKWAAITGISFLTYGIALLLILNILPLGIRGDILSFLSLQYEPGLIAVISLIVGFLFIIKHIFITKRAESLNRIYNLFMIAGFILVIVYSVITYVIPRTNMIEQTNKSERTITDMKTISVSIINYITDNNAAPDHQGTYDENSRIYTQLVPFYIRRLPVKDQWGNDFYVYCGKSFKGKYGIMEYYEDDFLVVSTGRDGKMETWSFNGKDPESGFFETKNLEDFDRDLVIWSGSIIRAPKKYKGRY